MSSTWSCVNLQLLPLCGVAAPLTGLSPKLLASIYWGPAGTRAYLHWSPSSLLHHSNLRENNEDSPKLYPARHPGCHDHISAHTGSSHAAFSPDATHHLRNLTTNFWTWGWPPRNPAALPRALPPLPPSQRSTHGYLQPRLPPLRHRELNRISARPTRPWAWPDALPPELQRGEGPAPQEGGRRHGSRGAAPRRPSQSAQPWPRPRWRGACSDSCQDQPHLRIAGWEARTWKHQKYKLPLICFCFLVYPNLWIYI